MSMIADDGRTDIPLSAIEPSGLWHRLKTGTQATHARLDGRIMAGRPFESLERYALFLRVQHDFHLIVSPFYRHAALALLLPDLEGRDRLSRIEQDLRDLGIAIPARPGAEPDHLNNRHRSLGWLYVAEGSNLGAAFLLKAARQLDLSESFGARHLAAAPEGRGRHWKTFTTALDDIALSPAEEAEVIAGANEAFERVLHFVERRFFSAAAD